MNLSMFLDTTDLILSRYGNLVFEVECDKPQLRLATYGTPRTSTEAIS